MEQLKPILTYFPILASAGVLFTCWGSIKMFLQKVLNLFIIEVEVQNIASKSVQRYANKYGKSIKLGKFVFGGKEEYVKPVQRKIGIIIPKINFEPQLWFIGGIPLLVLNQQGESKENNNMYYDQRLKIFFLRFTLNHRKLIERSIIEYNKQELVNNQRFFIKQIYGYGKQQIIDESRNRRSEYPEPSSERADYFTDLPLLWKPEDIGYGTVDKIKTSANYVFCEETNALFQNVKMWKESETWYRDRSIPFRRGALLYGRPGSGKSSCIRVICQLLDLPLYIFDLASLSNKELIEKWQECQITTPCAVLFDDIDAIYDKRNLVNPDTGPSFDCFLNCLSGALPAEGMFVFVTTNNIDKLDSALGVPGIDGITTRGGRLEIMVKLNEINIEGRKKLAEIILKDVPHLIPEQVRVCNGLTASQCVEVYSKIALEHLWNKKV